MKAYLITTGTVFGLIAIAHVVRMAMEGSHLVRDPVYVLLTIAAAALSAWGWCLVPRLPTRGR